MTTTAQFELSRLPISVIGGAYRAFTNDRSPVTKAQAVAHLAEMVTQGLLTVDQVRSAKPLALNNPTSGSNPESDAKVDSLSASLTAMEAVIERANNNASSALASIGKLGEQVQSLAQTQATLAEKVGAFKLDETVLAGAVAQAIDNAFAPFRSAVESAGVQTIVADLASIHPVETRLAHQVFGLADPILNNAGMPLTVQIWNDPTAPAVDADFIWSEGILRHLLLSDATGDPLWFGGEKGTGKSETARQFAARTGRAFKRINFHKYTTTESYLGATGLVNGATEFQAGDFLMAYTRPGTVILLDEVTNADPGELAPLNGFLEPNACVNFGGSRWTKAPGVLTFVADNTFGSGDDTGRYAGTRQQNIALVDRFARVIPFTFLPAAQEIQALVSRTGASVRLVEHVHKAITVARTKVTAGELVDAPSIRSAIAFIRALTVLSCKDAWESAVVARQPSEGHAVLWSIFETQISQEVIKQNLPG